jgi:hypothetical protein
MDDLAQGQALIHALDPPDPTSAMPSSQTRFIGGSRLRDPFLEAHQRTVLHGRYITRG